MLNAGFLKRKLGRIPFNFVGPRTFRESFRMMYSNLGLSFPETLPLIVKILLRYLSINNTKPNNLSQIFLKIRKFTSVKDQGQGSIVRIRIVILIPPYPDLFGRCRTFSTGSSLGSGFVSYPGFVKLYYQVHFAVSHN